MSEALITRSNLQSGTVFGLLAALDQTGHPVFECRALLIQKWRRELSRSESLVTRHIHVYYCKKQRWALLWLFLVDRLMLQDIFEFPVNRISAHFAVFAAMIRKDCLSITRSFASQVI